MSRTGTMRIYSVFTGIALLTLAGGVLSQPAEKLKSGPQRGAMLPGSFAPIKQIASVKTGTIGTSRHRRAKMPGDSMIVSSGG